MSERAPLQEQLRELAKHLLRLILHAKKGVQICCAAQRAEPTTEASGKFSRRCVKHGNHLTAQNGQLKRIRQETCTNQATVQAINSAECILLLLAPIHAVEPFFLMGHLTAHLTAARAHSLLRSTVICFRDFCLVRVQCLANTTFELIQGHVSRLHQLVNARSLH